MHRGHTEELSVDSQVDQSRLAHIGRDVFGRHLHGRQQQRQITRRLAAECVLLVEHMTRERDEVGRGFLFAGHGCKRSDSRLGREKV